MILYPSVYGGIPLLVSCYGSAIPRAIIPATLCAVIAIIIEFNVPHSYMMNLIASPHPYAVFTGIVSFLLVFRVNASYARYWEACEFVRHMGSKWGDSVGEAMVHDIVWKPGAKRPPLEEHALFRAQLAHTASLYHATALAHLRGQTEFGLDEKHYQEAPPKHWEQIDGPSWPWIELIRTWLRYRSRHLGYKAFLNDHPLHVLGGISQEERQKFKKLSSVERVNSLYVQLNALFQARRGAGGLAAAEPPSFARLGNYISDGNVSFVQACKIVDTPLPFAYQQICSLSLAIFMLTFPLLAVSRFGGDTTSTEKVSWLPPCVSFLCTLTFYGLYEISREMEEPFLHPPNALPLNMMQNAFNARLRVSATRVSEMARDVGTDGKVRHGVLGSDPDLSDDPAMRLVKDWHGNEVPDKADITPPAAGSAPGAGYPGRGGITGSFNERRVLQGGALLPGAKPKANLHRRTTDSVIKYIANDRFVKERIRVLHVA